MAKHVCQFLSKTDGHRTEAFIADFESFYQELLDNHESLGLCLDEVYLLVLCTLDNNGKEQGISRYPVMLLSTFVAQFQPTSAQQEIEDGKTV